jgi:UDP-GlcNAc:undecaprenyl-phosphate GlcNAc-1-phosphate transferase
MTYLITPLCKKIAITLQILDYPGGRKLQNAPVAYLGGLAIALPITSTSIFLPFIGIPDNIKNEYIFGILFPSIVIATVGLFDDILQLSPLFRFIMQSGVGMVSSILIQTYSGGIKLTSNAWINGILTTLWVVTIINAINFIDNMDGLATSIAIIISFSLFVLSLLSNQHLVASLSIAICSASIGFLFWNKKPASIYLGDLGALYLGFLLSAITIRVDFGVNSTLVKLLVPLLIFLVPLVDLFQVVIHRTIVGRSPFQAGRDHLSHLLLNRKIEEETVLFALTFASALFAFFGVLLAYFTY